MIQKWTDLHQDEVRPVHIDPVLKDRRGFNYDALLNQMKSEESVEVLLDMVRQGVLKKEFISLRKAFKKEENEAEIHRIAHSIKGTSLTLYFERLEVWMRQLEELNPNYYGEDASSLLQKVDKEYEVVEKIITEKTYL